MKYIIAVLLLMISSFALANNIGAATKAEIDYLFNYLKNSGCEFNRNGSWYAAPKATEHLKTKYDYLIKKNMLTDTESFIDKAASKSSVSGKSYQVRCEGKPAINSKEWFLHELANFRKNSQ